MPQSVAGLMADAQAKYEEALQFSQEAKRLCNEALQCLGEIDKLGGNQSTTHVGVLHRTTRLLRGVESGIDPTKKPLRPLSRSARL